MKNKTVKVKKKEKKREENFNLNFGNANTLDKATVNNSDEIIDSSLWKLEKQMHCYIKTGWIVPSYWHYILISESMHYSHISFQWL